MHDDLLQRVPSRRGHFLLESGHHGELWLDLELLCLRPLRLQPFASELARQLSHYRVDAVCGPLVEGAFVAMMVASALNVDFFYTEQVTDEVGGGLYPVTYRLPIVHRERIAGKRVAIVNDVINAGSAVRGTYRAIEACPSTPVVIATLLTLGDTPLALATEWSIDLITIASLSSAIWRPEECPMCANSMPLENPAKSWSSQKGQNERSRPPNLE